MFGLLFNFTRHMLHAETSKWKYQMLKITKCYANRSNHHIIKTPSKTPPPNIHSAKVSLSKTQSLSQLQDWCLVAESDLWPPCRGGQRKDNCSVGTIRVLSHPSVESLNVTWGRLVIGHFSLKTAAIFFHLEQTTQRFSFLSPLLVSCISRQRWHPGVILILSRLTCSVSCNFAHLASVLQGP